MRYALIAASAALVAVLVAPVHSATSAAALDIPSGAYALDQNHASVTWRVMHMGLSNYTARFAKFDASVNLDAAAPAKSSVTATIDPTSVRTDFPGQEDFDGKIGKDERILNGAKFPEIKFASRKIEVVGLKQLKITGDLTMLGITKPVTLDTTIVGTLKSHPFLKKAAFGISARGTLKRSDFGLAYPAPPGLGDAVELQIEAEFLQAQ
jgi:polyisoprenoid-binding protein YceI